MSNNLNLTQVVASQNQKEVTINGQSAALDAALTERLAVSLVSAVSLTDAQFRGSLLFSCSGQTVATNLTVPAIKRSIFLVHNAGSYNVNVVRGSTTLAVLPGGFSLFATDGTSNGLSKVSESVAVLAYDIACYIAGTPEALELVLSLVAARSFTLPVNLTGSKALARTSATAESIFEIQHNGSTVGTITFAAGGTVGTFAFASAVTFAVGDYLDIVAPSTADATIANITFNLLGTR